MRMKEMAEKIARANNELLVKYKMDEVEIVRACHEDMVKIVSDYYSTDEGMADIGRYLSECKRDYMSEAAEDYGMSAERFEEIMELVELISTMEANAVA